MSSSRDPLFPSSAAETVEAVRNREPVTVFGVKYVPAEVKAAVPKTLFGVKDFPCCDAEPFSADAVAVRRWHRPEGGCCDKEPCALFVAPVPRMQPLGLLISAGDVSSVWDTFIVPTQTLGAGPQSVETRALMAILRAVHKGLSDMEASG